MLCEVLLVVYPTHWQFVVLNIFTFYLSIPKSGSRTCIAVGYAPFIMIFEVHTTPLHGLHGTLLDVLKGLMV